MTKTSTLRLALIHLSAALVIISVAVEAWAAPPVSVIVTRPQIPLLVRNDQGPLARVEVTLTAGAEARLTSLSFDFAGTDDPADLESVRLFATGDKDVFSTATPASEPVAPAGQLAVKVDRPLTTGKNVFWLAGRLKPTPDLSHHIVVRCTKLVTTAGEVEPQASSPSVRQRIGVAMRRHQDDGVHTYRIPALTTTNRGTQLCVYDMRRQMGRDLQGDIDIGLSRSTDGGATWEPVRVIMDQGEYGGLPQDQNGCSDPGIIVDRKTGEIFCFAVWMNGKPGKHQWNDDGSEPGFEIGKAAQLLMVRSTDDGVTWSKPENLTRQLKQESWWLLAPSPQSGFTMPDGTLVMPVQGRTGRERLATFATIMVSRDHGRSWSVGEPAYTGGNECQAARLSDDAIMLNIRNDREKFRAVSVTNDLGKTWRQHPTSRKTLIEPTCNGSLLRIDYREGDATKRALLFANPHSQQGRTHHTLQVSFDDGLTWPESHRRLLDEGRGAGYPSLTQIDEQHVGLVFEGSQAHLTYLRFPISELVRPAQK